MHINIPSNPHFDAFKPFLELLGNKVNQSIDPSDSHYFVIISIELFTSDTKKADLAHLKKFVSEGDLFNLKSAQLLIKFSISDSPMTENDPINWINGQGKIKILPFRKGDELADNLVSSHESIFYFKIDNNKSPTENIDDLFEYSKEKCLNFSTTLEQFYHQTLDEEFINKLSKSTKTQSKIKETKGDIKQTSTDTKKRLTTDPVADMLTRIRNAQAIAEASVDVPASRFKKAIAELLVREGYLKSVEDATDSHGKAVIRIGLKYGPKRKPLINSITRVSRPGRRAYSKAKGVPVIRGGLGLAIVSTSQGLMVDRDAKRKNLDIKEIYEVW